MFGEITHQANFEGEEDVNSNTQKLCESPSRCSKTQPRDTVHQRPEYQRGDDRTDQAQENVADRRQLGGKTGRRDSHRNSRCHSQEDPRRERKAPHRSTHSSLARRTSKYGMRGRRIRRLQADGAYQSQGDCLLRSGYYRGAIHGTGSGKPSAAIKLGPAQAEATLAQNQPAAASVIEYVFPASIIDAMARGNVLELVVFSFLFGAACAAIGAKAGPVVAFCESLADVMFRYTKYVMFLAPLGVSAAIAVTVASKGSGVLLGLGKLILTMYAAQVVFVTLVLGSVVILCGIPLGAFYRAAREPFLIAFSTASSEAALPLALENMEQFGVPPHIVAFVLPTGYSFNANGSTLYLSLASVFVAQAAGINLSLGQQLLMMLILMLTSKGVAGVPRQALVLLAGALSTFHLPMEGVAVLLGVDAILDMARSSVNVLGNCLASAVVARWEGVEFSPLSR